MDIFVFVHSKNTRGLFSKKKKKKWKREQKKNIVPAKMFELPPSITFTNFIKKKKKLKSQRSQKVYHNKINVLKE